MRHLRHHAADRRGVLALDHLIQPGKAQALDDQLMFDRGRDCRPHPLQVHRGARSRRFRFTLLSNSRHDYSSSTALPRCAATSCRSRNLPRALNVALMTLCGLVVPIDLVSTFCAPAEVITARTAPPAMTPVPSGAGFSNTMPDPYRPSTWCGIVVWFRFTRSRFFLADSIPLRMACGTSFALPEP